MICKYLEIAVPQLEAAFWKQSLLNTKWHRRGSSGGANTESDTKNQAATFQPT